MWVKVAATVVGFAAFALAGPAVEGDSAAHSGSRTVAAHPFTGHAVSASTTAGRYREDVCMPM
jgi:hypothetical protein